MSRKSAVKRDRRLEELNCGLEELREQFRLCDAHQKTLEQGFQSLCKGLLEYFEEEIRLEQEKNRPKSFLEKVKAVFFD